jgi:hypothetical protein
MMRQLKVVRSGGLGHHAGMAFRIHDGVVRGEVVNRVKGIVRGKIWKTVGRNETL